MPELFGQAELGQVGLATEPPREAGLSWLTILGFCFLTFNSGMAIYRSNDAWSIAFVSSSYIDLLLLFCCLRYYERGVPDSPRRGYLKVCVWVLTTLLTFMFSYKLAATMPPVVALVVWAMAAVTVVGVFFAFFLHREKEGNGESQP